MIDSGNLEILVCLSMFALPVGVALLLAIIIAMDVVDGIKFRKQKQRFFELYGMCIEKHGLSFAQKVYEGCRNPWIGMDKMIAVFEHHCGIKNELSKKL